MTDVKNAIKHLKNHQSYPATREELVAECNHLSDFSEQDKKEFESRLPAGTYNSPEQVMRALALQ